MKVDVELEPFTPYYGPRMQTRMREWSQKYAWRGTSLDIRTYGRALGVGDRRYTRQADCEVNGAFCSLACPSRLISVPLCPLGLPLRFTTLVN